MTRTTPILVAAGLCLAGCGKTDRLTDGGGFETSDLQARVTLPSGQPATRSLVWLVRSRGDSLPASVLDSSWTDGDGLARFSLDSLRDRSGIGIDVQRDSLRAVGRDGFAQAKILSIQLSETGRLQASPDSTGEMPKLFAPGSHFVSQATENRLQTRLVLPRGIWDIGVRTRAGVAIERAVRVDSTPRFVGRHDSILVENVWYRSDPTYSSLLQWQAESGDLATLGELLPQLLGDDTGIATFQTRPKALGEGTNPGLSQVGSGVVSPVLPSDGAFRWSFRTGIDPSKDSGVIRRVRLVDSNGNGVDLGIQCDGKTPVWISTLGATSSALAGTLDIGKATSKSAWTIAWSPTQISITLGDAPFATVSTTATKFAGLQLLLETMATRPGTSGKMQVWLDRLYLR